jgi:hypothetical protein
MEIYFNKGGFMELAVSEQQAVKNRAVIQEMWKKIPSKWIDLDSFLLSPEYSSRAKIARVCDGATGPHNVCDAVGCFAGWNWTNHRYRGWCDRNKLHITTTVNLSVWLGLKVADHPYFHSRQKLHLSEKQEVSSRIKAMMTTQVYTEKQEVVTKSDARL